MEEQTPGRREGEYFDGFEWRKIEDTALPSAPNKTQSDMAYKLSDRELEILRMMSSNMTAKQMAEQLLISHRTVQFHQDSMYWKLGISGRESRKAAVDKGRRLGLIK
jgi:DNA-binding CsgD family transcriptional regulator